MMRKNKNLILVSLLVIIGFFILCFVNNQKSNQPINGVYEYTRDPNVTLTIKNNTYSFKGNANFVDYFGQSGTFSKFEDEKYEDYYSFDQTKDGPHMQFIEPDKKFNYPMEYILILDMISSK